MMKVLGIILVAGVLVAIGALGWQRLNQQPAAAPEAGPGQQDAPGVLGVDRFMREVDRYPGTVQVEGIVSSVAADRQLFSMIDSSEFRRCGTVTCPSLVLPVRWSGTPPRKEQAVRVTGQVEQADGKLLFAAESVEAAGASSDAGG